MGTDLPLDPIALFGAFAHVHHAERSPLRTFVGRNIGTLCAMDRNRRTCTAEEIAGLTRLRGRDHA